VKDLLIEKGRIRINDIDFSKDKYSNTFLYYITFNGITNRKNTFYIGFIIDVVCAYTTSVDK